MILSAYRNPPFRPPSTPKTKSSPTSAPLDNNNKTSATTTPPPPPPPQDPQDSQRQTSPHKRKNRPEDRPPDQAPAAPPTRDLPAASGIASSSAAAAAAAASRLGSPDCAPDSPRTRVAERLHGLEISRSADGAAGRGGSERESPCGSPRKKVKLAASPPGPGAPAGFEGARGVCETLGAAAREARWRDDGVCEGSGSETEGVGLDVLSQGFRLCEESDREGEGEAASAAGWSRETAKKHAFATGSRRGRLASPPPLPPVLPGPSEPPASTSSLPALAIHPLTWHPSEITGATIDPSTPDDDGEGINGIGFRPTPAIAYARSQKRKQQVSEWKAREAREARQKRLANRRRGASGGGGGRDGPNAGRVGKGRSVRFAADAMEMEEG